MTCLNIPFANINFYLYTQYSVLIFTNSKENYKKKIMQTLTYNTPNSGGYIRCGEILKSENGFQDPYILRCVHCKEIYLLLESFIFHLNDKCKKSDTVNKNIQEHMNYRSDEAEVVNEPLECEEPPAKMEDPLIVVKSETDIDRLIIKIEPSSYDEGTGDEIEASTDLNTTKTSNQEDDIEDVETCIESEDECESQLAETDEVEIIQKSCTPNGPSSSFVSTFMKSDEHLTVLIAAFRNQPQLWNKSLPHFGNKLKRRDYMMKIAEDLNRNHNININGSQVSAVIVHLYRKYRDHLLKAQENDDSKRQLYVKPWYLRQLNFIESYLQNYSLEILDSNHPALSPEQIVKILEIYKNLPHLWNSNLIENHCRNKRHESILEMVKQLETHLKLEINENLLEQYLRTIHNNFSREKRRIINTKKSNNKEDKIVQTHSDYYEHLQFLFDHVPPFKCSVCGGDSISPLHFKIHTSTHDGTMPFTCSQCNRTFKGVNVYTSHAKRHFEDLNYICNECGKKFVNYTNLRLHMRIHTGDKPYCCEMCGDSFRFQQTLNNHRRRHEKRYLHTCKICSQGFYSKMRHDDHMNSHMNIRSHVCDICNKAFITKRALKNHKVVHEDVRNYACKLCGKTFKHKTGVNQHMKTHDIATNEERVDV